MCKSSMHMTTFTCTFDCIKSTANVLGHTDIKALSMPRYYNVTFLEVKTCLFNLVAFFFTGPRGKQLEGDECPLHVQHPPTGEEFALGCGVCRNAHTF